MTIKEKAHQGGGPIPEHVLADNSEYTPQTLRLQARRLVRLYAVNAAMAEAIAPLVFLEALR